MNWIPIYAVLLFTSTSITFFCGLILEKFIEDKKKQKIFLTTSLLINFGILFIFKYYNFINSSICSLLSHWHISWYVPNLDLLLPVGISFYTFQAVGYSIDVYRGTIKAEKNFFTYSLFVSFFPQLVAGPIERAKNLLPQFHIERTLNSENAKDGIKLMIWGFFMKLCIADVLGGYVDAIYNNIANHNGSSIVLATIFFTFQIYCDFAGYSLIAIGSAKVMGYSLMDNFKQPYLSLSIKEFWRRWHISLSTWFSDYLYIPLGGNRVKYARHLINLMITFLISGLWHGANWTFLLWGGLHGSYLILENIIFKFVYKPKYDTFLSKVLYTAFCFILVSFAWIFFRANNINDAFIIITKILSDWDTIFVDNSTFIYGSFAIVILIAKDITSNYNLNFRFMDSKYCLIRYLSIIFFIIYILLFGALGANSFIYFQF